MSLISSLLGFTFQDSESLLKPVVGTKYRLCGWVVKEGLWSGKGGGGIKGFV